MMEAHSTSFVEETLCQRTWPPGGSGPTRSVDAVLIESIKPVKSTLTDSEPGGAARFLSLFEQLPETKGQHTYCSALGDRYRVLSSPPGGLSLAALRCRVPAPHKSWLILRLCTNLPIWQIGHRIRQSREG
jgi:hypothetical protein